MINWRWQVVHAFSGLAAAFSRCARQLVENACRPVGIAVLTTTGSESRLLPVLNSLVPLFMESGHVQSSRAVIAAS